MDVKRARDKVWIQGVKGFSPADYASSPHGCQARILQILGESLGYNDLICYSGFAFRVSVHEEMCPSAAHPFCGYECVKGSHRALPWRVQIFESLPWAKPIDNREAFEAEACAAIKGSVDEGIPVHYGGEEDGLIIGYGDGGQRWWCVHPYHKWGKEAFWHHEAKGFAGGNWPWGIVVWREPKPNGERVSKRELTIAALRQAVAMWTSDKIEAYYTGQAAYAHWLKWLKGADGKEKEAKKGMQGNGWCFDVLIHSRRIAGRWLKQQASLFSGEAEKHLAAAADQYRKIAPLCSKGYTCSWDLAPGPDRYKEWSQALRDEQMKRLKAAQKHDAAAVAAIEQALAVIDG